MFPIFCFKTKNAMADLAKDTIEAYVQRSVAV